MALTKAELLDRLGGYDDDEEIDLAELERAIEEDHEALIEELEERQHKSGFYAFQDMMAMMRFER